MIAAPPFGSASGIDTRHEPLCTGFLISGGAVDLAGQIEVLGKPSSPAKDELGRVGEVIFYCVGRSHDFGILATYDGLNEFHLNIERQAW